MRKIGIIGAGESRVNAPFGEEGWEFWSVNNLYECLVIDSFTSWFELHDIELKNDIYYRRGEDTYKNISIKEYLEKLAELDIPVYMQKHWDIIPKSIEFPFLPILKQFRNYHGCSFSWMLAFALLKPYQISRIETIGLWGIDLEGAEYYNQRPTTEYFLGLAEGMGIEIIIDPESSLLKLDYLYAFQENYEYIKTIHVNLKEIIEIIAIALQQEVQ